MTFGELGTLFADDLWPECWYRSYPMCGACWQAAHQPPNAPGRAGTTPRTDGVCLS